MIRDGKSGNFSKLDNFSELNFRFLDGDDVVNFCMGLWLHAVRI